MIENPISAVAVDANSKRAAIQPPLWRAIVIGALLVPISIYFGNYAYVVTQALEWGQTSLLRGPVFVLFLLALANIALRRFGRRMGLAASEMLVIYSMVAIATCISGFGQLQFLVNLLPAGSYFSSPDNHYDQFLHFIPPYLIPNSPRAIHDFYFGHVSFLRPDILAAWAVPVVIWSAFLVVLTTVTLCLASLLSRQWIRSERLTFPLVELPLKMAEGASSDFGGLFRSRAMWAGFVLAGLLESIDYLNYFYPSLPYIQLKPYHLEKFLTVPPWNAIGVFTVALYPFAIGIAYLLSLEVSFSCWFFYLLTKLENILTAQFGVSAGSIHGLFASPPYLYEQGIGAFLALGVYLLWRARKMIFPSLYAESEESQNGETGGLMSQRAALWTALVGFVLLGAFLVLIGLPVFIAIAFLVIYLLIVTVLTRIVAEAGAGWAWAPSVAIHGVIMDATGVNSVHTQTLNGYGLLSWFDGEMRDICMPHQMEAMKMRDELGSGRKQMLWALLIAGVLSCFAGFATYLQIYYHFGAASAHVRPALAGVGLHELQMVNGWIIAPREPDYHALGGMAAGALIVTALALLRQHFVWWPLHPIGYALAGTQSMDFMWFPFLIGWAIKALTLRYGGVKMYRVFLPFFLGLILGDYIVPTLWGFWGMATGTQVYMSFPL